ncbi:MAG: hypothetical protein AB1824_10505 [Acidobacteriota bacterium]
MRRARRPVCEPGAATARGGGMVYDELDSITRRYMLEEFDAERKVVAPYRPVEVPAEVWIRLQDRVREIIVSGHAVDLAAGAEALAEACEAAKALGRRRLAEWARFEFSTWYVRGFSRRLLEEGEAYCLVVHGEDGRSGSGKCGLFQGQLLPLKAVYHGHRARYWPEPGDRFALTVPACVECRHTIRRL